MLSLSACGILPGGAGAAHADKEDTYRWLTYGAAGAAVYGAVKGNIPVAAAGAVGAVLARKKWKDEIDDRRDHEEYGYWGRPGYGDRGRYGDRSDRRHDRRYDRDRDYRRGRDYSSDRYDRRSDRYNDRNSRSRDWDRDAWFSRSSSRTSTRRDRR